MVHVMSEVIWYYDEAEGGGVQKVAGLGSYVKAGDFHDMEADRDAQRLRANTAEAEIAECKRRHLRSCQIAIGKSQLAKERHAQLIEAEEIRASWQNGYDVKCQNILLLTLANLELRALLQRVIDSSVLSFEADAPEELESLEADICAALKPNPEAESHE